MGLLLAIGALGLVFVVELVAILMWMTFSDSVALQSAAALH